MGRFLLGILTILILLAGMIGVLSVLEQNGIVDVKPAVIGVMGKLPGWGELPQIFSAGKKGLKNWQEKEKIYQARVDALNRQIAKLQKDLDQALTNNSTPATKDKPTVATTPVNSPVANTKLTDASASTKQAARLLGEMKPQAAADILLKIQPDVALSILQLVETRKAAKIIEVMPVDNGSALLAKLAGKR